MEPLLKYQRLGARFFIFFCFVLFPSRNLEPVLFRSVVDILKVRAASCMIVTSKVSRFFVLLFFFK